jgi:hypothetical protein
MGWHVPPCGMTSGAAAAGYGAMSFGKPGGDPGPDLPAPVIPRPIASGDVVIPPVIPITNVFGLCGARQGDVVTMRRDGEPEYQFRMRVGLPT